MNEQELYDEDDLYDTDGVEEWQEGQCDHCPGSPPEQLAAAAKGGLVPVCACAIGQGAGPDDCVCGTEDDEESAT